MRPETINHTQPTEPEFEIENDGVTHKPTGAKFTAYPGMPLHNVIPNRLGSVLPDGREYRESEVWEMAQKVWADQLRRRGYK